MQSFGGMEEIKELLIDYFTMNLEFLKVRMCSFGLVDVQ